MNKKYAKLLANGWEAGSENTFADLDLKPASELKAKAYLRARIIARIESLHISQSDIARKTHLTQPKVSKLMSDTSSRGFSSDKLMEIATRLGLDIEIRVRESTEENGNIVVSV
jgi:predicted XRE-type DNA-binding protein